MFCSLHRPYASPNIVTKLCEHPGCSLAPSFPKKARATGMGGHRNRRWCKQHSSGRDSEQFETKAGESRQCEQETVASQHAEKKDSGL